MMAHSIFVLLLLMLNCVLVTYGQDTPQAQPPPVVRVTASPDDSIIIAGTSLVTLTCTSTFSEAVSNEVTVSTAWSGPSGTQYATTASIATRLSNITYISTATLRSVQRGDSGEYTCTATVNSTSPLIIESEEASGTVVLVVADIDCGYSEIMQPNIGQVNLTLRGTAYPNNSEILLGCIGSGDDALLCLTDNIECCRTKINSTTGAVIQMGRYIFPNGSEVMSYSAGAKGFFRKRDRGEVSLSREYNPASSTGLYRCEIPDANGNTQTLYANIVVQLSYDQAPTDQTTLVIADHATTSTTTDTTTSDSQPSGNNCNCNTRGIIIGVVVGLLVVIILITVLVVIGVVWASKRYQPLKHDGKVVEPASDGGVGMDYEEIHVPDHLSTKSKTDNFPLSGNVAYSSMQPRENTGCVPQAQTQPNDDSDYVAITE